MGITVPDFPRRCHGSSSFCSPCLFWIFLSDVVQLSVRRLCRWVLWALQTV